MEEGGEHIQEPCVNNQAGAYHRIESGYFCYIQTRTYPEGELPIEYETADGAQKERYSLGQDKVTEEKENRTGQGIISDDVHRRVDETYQPEPDGLHVRRIGLCQVGPIEHEHLLESAQDDIRTRAGGGALQSGQVSDRHLFELNSSFLEPYEKFGAHHGAAGTYGEAGNKSSLKQLKGAVYVADAEPEEQSIQDVPTPGIDQPHEWISSRRTVAENDFMSRNISYEVSQFLETELQIGIGKEDPVVAGCLNTAPYRRPIALVRGMMNDANARILACQAVSDFAGAVAAAVVYDDDFIAVRNGPRHFMRGVYGRGDILFLVVGGKENGKRNVVFHKLSIGNTSDDVPGKRILRSN